MAVADGGLPGLDSGPAFERRRLVPTRATEVRAVARGQCVADGRVFPGGRGLHVGCLGGARRAGIDAQRPLSNTIQPPAMTCTPIRIGGIVAIVCGSRPRAPRCRSCKQRLGTRLCDWKIGRGKTCDVPLCDSCTKAPAPDKDLCPKHAAEWLARRPTWIWLRSPSSVHARTPNERSA